MKQTPASETDPFAALKQGVRWLWSLGDYPSIARLLEPCAERLALDAGIRPSHRVLDVAAGNGNFALAAATRGAVVIACDLAPAMVELGRERTRSSGLDVEWHEADAEALPFADGQFDVVGSVFGAIFAPRPQRVAAELFRVARPGGLVAMANYTDSGFLGAFSELLARYSSAPPVKLPSPFSWGDEAELRRRFNGYAASIQVRAGTITFRFPSLDDGLAFWERTNAPHVAMRTLLPPDTYTRFMSDARDVMRRFDAGDARELVLESGYITVVAEKSAESQSRQV